MPNKDDYVTDPTGNAATVSHVGSSSSEGHHRASAPILEVEQDGGIILAARLKGKWTARVVLGPTVRNRSAPTSLRPGTSACQHLGPGEHGGAGKQRRHVAAPIDRRDVKAWRPVERRSARASEITWPP